jgi:hypothetical protein
MGCYIGTTDCGYRHGVRRVLDDRVRSHFDRYHRSRGVN